MRRRRGAADAIPESNDGPRRPAALLAILGATAPTADVLCDVECGAGFTLTRLGDRVEARLHPGASFNAGGRPRRRAHCVEAATARCAGAAPAAWIGRSSTRSPPRRCGRWRRAPAARRRRRRGGPHKVAAAGCALRGAAPLPPPLAPPSSRNRLDARESRDQRGAVSHPLRGRARPGLDVQRSPPSSCEASADGKELRFCGAAAAAGTRPAAAPGPRRAGKPPGLPARAGRDPGARAALLAQRARQGDAAAAAAVAAFAARPRRPAAPAPAKGVDGRAPRRRRRRAFLRRLRGGGGNVVCAWLARHGPTSRARARHGRTTSSHAGGKGTGYPWGMACSSVQPSAAVPRTRFRHSAGAWLYAHCARSKSAGRKSLTLTPRLEGVVRRRGKRASGALPCFLVCRFPFPKRTRGDGDGHPKNGIAANENGNAQRRAQNHAHWHRDPVAPAAI